VSITSRFNTFLNTILLTGAQKNAGKASRESVVKVLNTHYYGTSSTTANSKFVGSWGKFTRLRPPRDVDVIYTLPAATYERFQQRTGNKQSQLLQEVKAVLGKNFSTTNVKGDGPVVKVPFAAYDVELIPAFKLQSGQYWVCMTNYGGSYAKADYDAENTLIRESHESSGKKTRELIRMMKRWQAYCSVPLKSFWIELIAVEFMATWEHKDKSREYFDYMIRDFLRHLEGKVHGTVYAPGTYEAMYLGSAWLTKATSARQRAEKACSLEPSDPAGAGDEWQKIFGTDIPKYT
jgi:hypothetical protein